MCGNCSPAHGGLVVRSGNESLGALNSHSQVSQMVDHPRCMKEMREQEPIAPSWAARSFSIEQGRKARKMLRCHVYFHCPSDTDTTDSSVARRDVTSARNSNEPSMRTAACSGWRDFQGHVRAGREGSHPPVEKALSFRAMLSDTTLAPLLTL